MPVGQFQVETDNELSTLPRRAAVTWLNSPPSQRPTLGVAQRWVLAIREWVETSELPLQVISPKPVEDLLEAGVNAGILRLKERASSAGSRMAGLLQRVIPTV